MELCQPRAILSQEIFPYFFFIREERKSSLHTRSRPGWKNYNFDPNAATFAHGKT